MIVETSAVVAILAKEPERTQFVRSIREDAAPKLSAASYFESAIVADRHRRDPMMGRELDALLDALSVEIVDVTAAQMRLARQAYRDYGKGSGHPAQLNFGDCFAYALAEETGEPLLYQGDDFVHTGIRSALDE